MKFKNLSEKQGAMIRQMRKAVGWSQSDLAERLGVSYQQVQKYEKGASVLNFARAAQIAEVFEVHPSIFFLDNGAGAAFSDEELGVISGFRRLDKKEQGFIRMVLEGLLGKEKAA